MSTNQTLKMFTTSVFGSPPNNRKQVVCEENTFLR